MGAAVSVLLALSARIDFLSITLSIAHHTIHHYRILIRIFKKYRTLENVKKHSKSPLNAFSLNKSNEWYLFYLLSKNIIPISPPHSPFNVLVKRNTRIPKNPCQPSPCGPGTLCTVNNLGNAICNCQPGLIPKPDTITGCGPECTQDPECYRGQVCLNQRCVDEPDPCNPSPCGPGTTCTANKAGGRFSNPICR